MVFLLDNDILEAIEKDNLSAKELRAIQRIGQSYLDGIHNIYASPKLIMKLSTLKSLAAIDREAFVILSNNLSSLRQWQSVPYQIVVKHRTPFNKVEENGVLKFNVSLEYVNKTQITHKPCLISESMKDCNYYYHMAMSLKEKMTGLSQSNIRLKKVAGGGNDTGIVLENEIEEGCICIVIADSDKKYPDCDDGGTLREIKKVISSLEKSTEAVYEVKSLIVREKENLISPRLYRLAERAKNYSDILDDLTSIYDNDITKEIYYYMDIKDGQNSKSFLSCSKTQELYERLYKQEVCASFKEIPNTLIKMRTKCNEKESETLFSGVGALIDEFEHDVFKG